MFLMLPMLPQIAIFSRTGRRSSDRYGNCSYLERRALNCLIATAIDVCILPGPTLDFVGPVRFQHVGLPIALVNVGISPRVVGKLFDIPAGWIISRNRTVGRNANQRWQPLIAGRVRAIVKVVPIQRCLECRYVSLR